jgi:hypothetical protein
MKNVSSLTIRWRRHKADERRQILYTDNVKKRGGPAHIRRELISASSLKFQEQTIWSW